MTDVIELLRAHDPERAGAAAPPIEPLLARLGEEPHRRGRRRPRPRRRGRVAVAVALACLAAIALVAVALGGSGGGGGDDALTPAGGADVIVHTVTRSSYAGRGGRRIGAVMQGPRSRPIGTMDGPVERWSAVDPTRWRSIMTLLPGRGMPGGTSEQAYADGVERTRDSWERAARVQRIPAGTVGGVVGGLPFGMPQDDGRLLLAGVADPRAAVARMLRSGEVRAAGGTTRDGRRLLRFVGETGLERTGRGATRPATRTTYLVDAGSYAPVIAATAFAMPRDGARGGPLGPFRESGTIVFDTYENLPLSRETAPLLRLGGPTR